MENKTEGNMKEIKEILNKNRIEDVSWVCSLSESELDMIISLKMLVLQRAKVIGHEKLAEKFDLKTLRALGFSLMEFLKGKVKGLSLSPISVDPAAFLDGCNLLKCNREKIMSMEELRTYIDNSSNRGQKRKFEDGSPCQKKKQKKVGKSNQTK